MEVPKEEEEEEKNQTQYGHIKIKEIVFCFSATKRKNISNIENATIVEPQSDEPIIQQKNTKLKGEKMYLLHRANVVQISEFGEERTSHESATGQGSSANSERNGEDRARNPRILAFTYLGEKRFSREERRDEKKKDPNKGEKDEKER